MSLCLIDGQAQNGDHLKPLAHTRNRAFEFAPDLQTEDPEAGSVGGPTVTDPGIQNVVYDVVNNLTGHGANIATGSDIRQRNRVGVGDQEALRRAVRKLGLSADSAREFTGLIVDARSTHGPRLAAFLDKLRQGA